MILSKCIYIFLKEIMLNILLKKFVLLFFICIFSLYLKAQDNDFKIGIEEKTGTNAAVYDLSDPKGINMEVNLWGFVKNPGRYIIPVNTTFLDLLSYSGGPIETSNLKDIRILRGSRDTLLNTTKVIKLNYDDFLWGEKIKSNSRANPLLQPGDVVLVLEEKRYTLREDIGFWLPIFSGLLTLATLIVTLSRN